jgi:hypothetical protein
MYAKCNSNGGAIEGKLSEYEYGVITKTEQIVEKIDSLWSPQHHQVKQTKRRL